MKPETDQGHDDPVKKLEAQFEKLKAEQVLRLAEQAEQAEQGHDDSVKKLEARFEKWQAGQVMRQDLRQAGQVLRLDRRQAEQDLRQAEQDLRQAEQVRRQAEQDLHNKRVKDQLLFPLYRRHMLVCAQEKVNQRTGNKHPHRESVAAPSLGVLQPGVVITAADLNIVFANDKGSLRGGGNAMAHDITVEEQEDAVLAMHDPVVRESIGRIFEFVHRPLQARAVAHL